MAVYFPNIPATFIHLPKAAGTSFREWLVTNNIEHHVPVGEEYRHCDSATAQTLYPNLGQVFGFVRNPYERMVSMYAFVGQIVQKQMEISRANLPNDLLLFRDCVRILEIHQQGFEAWLERLYAKESLTELIQPRAYLTQNIVAEWGNPNPQLAWFNDTNALTINTEVLEHEFIQIQDMFNCYAPLPHINTSTHNAFKECYNARSIHIVSTLHRDDFEAFNYAFMQC